MKKKVFFILSSLAAGGAERVFWLLTQHLDKSLYNVSLILLDPAKAHFSPEIRGVHVVSLDTIKASKSFFKLYKLLKREKPYAVFSTGGQVNMLVSAVSLFVHVPRLIARQTNIPDQRRLFIEQKQGLTQFLSKILFKSFAFKRFHTVVCQSDEMKASLLIDNKAAASKLVVIPNPVISPVMLQEKVSNSIQKKLIIAGRLVKLKGHSRLLKILKELPGMYRLTIAGDGPLKEEIKILIEELALAGRIEMPGSVPHLEELIAKHDLLVLTSFTEGFPNVVLEALSVGVPVVTFKVGGVSDVIIDGVNGYIVEQGDTDGFRDRILQACSRDWDRRAIKEDIIKRFSIQKITAHYQELID